MPRKPQNSAADAPVTRARGFGWAGALVATAVVAIVDWRAPRFEPGEFTVLALGAQFALQVAAIALAGLAAYLVASRFTARGAVHRVSKGGSATRPADSAERSLFDRHPDAVFELDAGCRLRHMNAVAGRMLNRIPEEVIGQGLEMIAAPDRVGPDLEHLRAALGGQAQIFDSVGVDSTGRRVQVQVTAVPRLIDGAVGGLYCIVKNVDAERRMYEQLAASESRLRAIVEHSMDAIFLSDPVAGRLLGCNPAAEALFGRSEAELRECSRDDVFDPELSDFESFIAARDEYGYARGILYLKRPDGTRIPVEATTAMFRDGRGRWRSSVTLRDISERLRQEREIKVSEQRYRALFEHSADAILLSRPDGTIDHANKAAETMFRCSIAELRRLGRNGLVDREDPGFRDLMEQRRTGNVAKSEFRMRRADGVWFLADVSVAAYEDTEGESRTTVVVRDFTETRELHRRIELLATAFRSANEALLVCDPDWRVLDANQAYEALVDLPRAQIIGSAPVFLRFGAQAGRISRAVESEGRWRGELLLRDGDGRLRTTRAGISRIRGVRDSQWFLVVNLEDISRMREFERRIDFLSYNDTLTGLPNLSALQQWFRDGTATAGRDVALVYLDLDRFKAINESFGHPTGDDVLIEVGRRLRQQCGPHDFVARLGGDDFVIVLTMPPGDTDISQRAGKFVASLAEPIESGSQRIYTSASAGIVLDARRGTGIDDLLRRADAAHAAAKRGGRGQVQVYDASMQRDVEEQALVESQLRDAIRQGELDLEYQPVVRLDDGRTVGLEALVRWRNPTLGDVAPARFIPVAEDSGLIVELGAWIFDRACRDARRWLDKGVVFGRVAVNVSPAQFQQPGFVDGVAGTLADHGLEGSHFTIEVTENMLMVDPERAIDTMGRLRALGISISLDDFGTGYSSLAYLRRFPLQGIKLDRMFVRTLPDSEVDAAIVRNIIELSGTLGMSLTAEGIESERQRKALLEWGCRYGQGFLFSEPMRWPEATRLLEAARPGNP